MAPLAIHPKCVLNQHEKVGCQNWHNPVFHRRRRMRLMITYGLKSLEVGGYRDHSRHKDSGHLKQFAECPTTMPRGSSCIIPISIISIFLFFVMLSLDIYRNRSIVELCHQNINGCSSLLWAGKLVRNVVVRLIKQSKNTLAFTFTAIQTRETCTLHSSKNYSFRRA